MKSAFPAWLKRLDPILEAEETNGLYQAFRERRLRLGLRGALRDHYYTLRFVLLVCLFLAVAVGLNNWLETYGPATLGWDVRGFLNILIVVVLLRNFRRRPARVFANRVPRLISHVFSPAAWLEQPALDVWMTGATGRDVAEAMYMELRGGCLMTWSVASAGLLIVMGALFWLRRGYLDSTDRVVLSILGVYVVAMGIPALIPMTAEAVRRRINKSLRLAIIEHFGEDAAALTQKPSRRTIRRHVWRLALVLPFVAALVADLVYYGFVRDDPFMIVLAPSLLCAGMWLQDRFLSFSAETEAHKCREVFRMSGAAYEYLMSTLFTSDPDAEQWAWNYRGIRAGRATRSDAAVTWWYGWLYRLRR